MVEEEPAAKKRRWWRVALGWLKDESFYKDITTRAVAAGIVALGAYFFALGAGYVSTPTGAEAAKGVANVVGSVAIAGLAAWGGWFLHGKADESPHRDVWPHLQVRLAFRGSGPTFVGDRFEDPSNTLLALRHPPLITLRRANLSILAIK
jgi:hypothetical protein